MASKTVEMEAEPSRYSQWLRGTADRMNDLAQRLGHGIALEAGDKELLRLATVPIVREMQADSAFNFVVGNKELAENLLEEIQSIYRDLL